MERTLIVLKGDAVQRKLVGRLVARFEDKGLKLAGLKMLRVGPDLAKRMYSVHEGKDFYAALVEFITASPVVAMVLEGNGAIAVCRQMMGATFGPQAQPGTIRGDLGMSKRYNLIHGSDCLESAQREIPLFFSPGEIVEYVEAVSAWVYAKQGNELI
jgi:nucleoside-diphosphate kinase